LVTTGAWFDSGGQRLVTAERDRSHIPADAPKGFRLLVDDNGRSRAFEIEVVHGCAVSVTQAHDNLNGTAWKLNADTILLSETPVRITDEDGNVGYGHLERAVQLGQA
jgi:alpha-D-ribose 1-methylphosphonate 5-triphosphate synthase subunit PhnG